MGAVKNAFHDEICEAADLEELGAEEYAWLRDSDRSARQGGETRSGSTEGESAGLEEASPENPSNHSG